MSRCMRRRVSRETLIAKLQELQAEHDKILKHLANCQIVLEGVVLRHGPQVFEVGALMTRCVRGVAWTNEGGRLTLDLRPEQVDPVQE